MSQDNTESTLTPDEKEQALDALFGPRGVAAFQVEEAR